MSLDPSSKAAQLLLRNHLGAGYCAGPEFPGDTIRRAIARLYKLGYLADAADGRMLITHAGRDYLNANHLRIKS